MRVRLALPKLLEETTVEVVEVRHMTQPEIRFKVGACTAAVFVNQVNTANGAGSHPRFS